MAVILARADSLRHQLSAAAAPTNAAAAAAAGSLRVWFKRGAELMAAQFPQVRVCLLSVRVCVCACVWRGGPTSSIQ